jgi:hypothetical protein
MQNKSIELSHVSLLQATSASPKVVATPTKQLVINWRAPFITTKLGVTNAEQTY